jgi:hypothetical protein
MCFDSLALHGLDRSAGGIDTYRHNPKLLPSGLEESARVAPHIQQSLTT